MSERQKYSTVPAVNRTLTKSFSLGEELVNPDIDTEEVLRKGGVFKTVLKIGVSAVTKRIRRLGGTLPLFFVHSFTRMHAYTRSFNAFFRHIRCAPLYFSLLLSDHERASTRVPSRASNSGPPYSSLT
jgi:hypothetical protein